MTELRDRTALTLSHRPGVDMYPVSVRIAAEHEDDVQSFERQELVGDATLFEFAHEGVHVLGARGHVLHSQAPTFGVERRRRIRLDRMDNTGLRQIAPCAGNGKFGARTGRIVLRASGRPALVASSSDRVPYAAPPSVPSDTAPRSTAS